MKKKNTIFNEVPIDRVPKNFFDLRHEVKLSCKFGYLYPILMMEVLPGELVKDQITTFARIAPQLSPTMHKMTLKINTFMVPSRLLMRQDLWEDFITGGMDGLQTVTIPYFTPASMKTHDAADWFKFWTTDNITSEREKLLNYLGLPMFEAPEPASPSNKQFSLLPLRACAKVWNDYYRDPTNDDEMDLDLDAQGDRTSIAMDNGHFYLRAKGWARDYFTSALPEAQRGAEVLMPLSGTGTVTYLAASEIVPGDPSINLGVGPTDLLVSDFGGTPQAVALHNIDEVLLNSSQVSINDLRTSLAVQRWLENNARGGPRYIEQMIAHYNHRVPDFRLQRAEYLGGGSQPVIISEVEATGGGDDQPVVGDLKGRGTSIGKSNGFSYTCQEHGYVVSFLSVLPDPAYYQGVPKLWSKHSRFDIAFPALANLGEQEILSEELFYSLAAGDDDDNVTTFGYIPRYAEYKFMNDRVAGDFRPNSTLGFWHETRNFLVRPVLSSDFTTMWENGFGLGDPMTQLEESFRRIFPVTDGTDYIWIQLFHNLSAKRPLPYFGVPRILG